MSAKIRQWQYKNLEKEVRQPGPAGQRSHKRGYKTGQKQLTMWSANLFPGLEQRPKKGGSHMATRDVRGGQFCAKGGRIF